MGEGGVGARGLLKFRIDRHIILLFISYFELLSELLKKKSPIPTVFSRS